MNKFELLAALGEGRGVRDLDVAVLDALGIETCLSPRGYRQRFRGAGGAWYAMWRPTWSLEDAVRLAKYLRLNWFLYSELGAAGASVAGGGRWTAATPALALTRAIVAKRLPEGEA